MHHSRSLDDIAADLTAARADLATLRRWQAAVRRAPEIPAPTWRSAAEALDREVAAADLHLLDLEIEEEVAWARAVEMGRRMVAAIRADRWEDHREAERQLVELLGQQPFEPPTSSPLSAAEARYVQAALWADQAPREAMVDALVEWIGAVGVVMLAVEVVAA